MFGIFLIVVCALRQTLRFPATSLLLKQRNVESAIYGFESLGVPLAFDKASAVSGVKGASSKSGAWWKSCRGQVSVVRVVPVLGLCPLDAHQGIRPCKRAASITVKPRCSTRHGGICCFKLLTARS